ncbi:MAG: hypothetical protein WCK39_00690 [Methanomassiliicoccales archaeon]
MNTKELVAYFASHVGRSESLIESNESLEMEDTIRFLELSTSGMVPIYIMTRNSFSAIYLYSVFVPKASLEDGFLSDLMRWNFSPSGGWGHGTIYEHRSERHTIFPPLSTGSSILDEGEPIVFLRRFWKSPRHHYLDVSEKLQQVLDVHWVDELSSFCRYDQRGDLKPVIQVIESDEYTLCTIEREALDYYQFLSESTLVRLFDIGRFPEGFDASGTEIASADPKLFEAGIYAKIDYFMGTGGKKRASDIRGIQLLSVSKTDAEMQKIVDVFPGRNERFETFISIDFKHGKVCDCSCDPKLLDSYFTDTGKPFQTSPAFFSPEVLVKYRSFSDKYILTPFSIQCRDSWFLESYYISEEGQIHAYLCDLASLPYEEQIYWKSFNQPPKGGISKRAFIQDFEGEWSDETDPIVSLSRTLDDFPSACQYGVEVKVWRYHGAISFRRTKRLSYVLVDSKEEWETQMLELANILVEGIDKRQISKVLAYVGCPMDSQLGSLKHLRKYLELVMDKNSVDEIMIPLETIQYERSNSAAHANVEVSASGLRDRYLKLLQSSDKSMSKFSELVGSHIFDLP